MSVVCRGGGGGGGRGEGEGGREGRGRGNHYKGEVGCTNKSTCFSFDIYTRYVGIT